MCSRRVDLLLYAAILATCVGGCGTGALAPASTMLPVASVPTPAATLGQVQATLSPSPLLAPATPASTSPATAQASLTLVPVKPTPTPLRISSGRLEPTPSLQATATPEPTQVEPTVEIRPHTAAVPSVAESPTPAPSPTTTPVVTLVPTPVVSLVPTPVTASITVLGGPPVGLDVDSASSRLFIVDVAGVIWVSEASRGVQQTPLEAPFKVGPRLPLDLAVDQGGEDVFVAASSDAAGACGAPSAPGCVLILDSRSGKVRALISLPGVPSDLRIDSGLGLLFVVVPSRKALVAIDVRAGRVLDGTGGTPNRTIDSLPQITSLALDAAKHTLYMSHRDGEVTIVDVSTGKPSNRVTLTGSGLADIATARGRAYAINAATRELAVLDPSSMAINRFILNEQPDAISASEATGIVYILSLRANVLLAVDPSDGSELGRVMLVHPSMSTGLSQSNVSIVRPRLVLDQSDETVYASMPEMGWLAAIAPEQFVPPLVARDNG